jgi:hypothetical protein
MVMGAGIRPRSAFDTITLWDDRLSCQGSRRGSARYPIYGPTLHCKKYVAMHKNRPYVLLIEVRPQPNWAPTVG